VSGRDAILVGRRELTFQKSDDGTDVDSRSGLWTDVGVFAGFDANGGRVAAGDGGHAADAQVLGA